MTTTLMTIERFQDQLDRYGENLAAWPENERSQAETLLSQSQPARDLLAEAAAIGGDLRAAAPKAPPGLVDRILAVSGAPTPPSRKE